jgi:hypothetical protein
MHGSHWCQLKPFQVNGAKLTLRECGPGAILCNPERVLSVIHAVPSVPKSEFCGIALIPFVRENLDILSATAKFHLQGGFA